MGRDYADDSTANKGGTCERRLDRGANGIGENGWADVYAPAANGPAALLSIGKISRARNLFSEPWRRAFEAPDVFEGLAFADEGGFVPVYEDFGGEAAGVVVGAHDGAVSAGAEEGDVIAGGDFGEGAIFAEEIAGFADGADDVGRNGFTR